MQMVFPRTAHLTPTGRSRPLAGRGAFALEPVGTLPRLAERVARLAERALEPNPFLLPAFLQPAILALGSNRLKLATYSIRDELCFFAPVQSGGFGGPRLTVWTHPYAPLGSPLVARDTADAVADGLLRYMRGSGRKLLVIPELPLQGPTAAALRAAAGRHGFWTEAARQMRPILHPGAGAGGFEDMVAPKRRRELERQLRKLSESGAVSHMSARTPSDVEAAFGIFIALEAGGWKGRRGSALQMSAAIHDFAREAVKGLAQQGLAAVDVLRVGERPIAALIRLDHAGLSIPWKIAYDESFAAFSPGKQLMCDETRRWLADPAVSRVDPVCDPENPLMSGLWTEREPYGTLLISSQRAGVRARLGAGLIDLRRAAKGRAKALLKTRPPAAAR